MRNPLQIWRKIIWSFRALRWRLKTRETPVLYGRSRRIFDLLILDLMLPEVDGFEICREVREKKDIPIIMVSAKKMILINPRTGPWCG